MYVYISLSLYIYIYTHTCIHISIYIHILSSARSAVPAERRVRGGRDVHAAWDQLLRSEHTGNSIIIIISKSIQ